MSIDIETLRSLGNRHRASYARGHILYHEGSSTGPLYVVLRGSVAFRVRDPASGGERVVETVRAGDFFGEVSCFSGTTRHDTAVVQEEGTILLVVDAESAFGLLAASPRFGTAVIRRLCERVRSETARSLQLSHQVAETRAAHEQLLEKHAELEQTIAQIQEQVSQHEAAQAEAAPEQPAAPSAARVNLSRLAEGMAEAARAAQREGLGEADSP
jgi:CRP-like cAMP-binding protein